MAFVRLGKVSILGFSTPGSFELANQHAFELERLGTWTAATPYSPCAGMARLRLQDYRTDLTVGIMHLSSSDMLVVTLMDGSFHVVENVSTTPKLDYAPEAVSQELTSAARLLFKTNESQASKEKLNRLVYMKTYGFAATDASGAHISWVYEFVRYFVRRALLTAFMRRQTRAT